MGTSLRLITSKLVTRSLLPTLVSSSCFHSIINAGHQRGYSTMPKDDFSDHSWLNVKCPKISHLSFTMRMDAINRWVSLSIPDEGLKVDLAYLPALKVEEMKACAEETLFVQGKPHKEVSLNLLDKTSSSDDIKEEKKDGMIEVTTPNKDGVILNIIANEIISSFSDMTTKRGWAYYDMFFDRSILGKGLCPIIATLSSIKSFSLLKETMFGDLFIYMSLRGWHYLKVTPQGLRVSLIMHGLRRDQVKSSYDYDTLFIEGKSKKRHYITGIKLPEGFQKKSSMIRKHMKGDQIFAFIPCDVKKLELLRI